VRILVVGGGAREHAICWRLVQNPTIDRLYAAPGNAGIAELATTLPVEATDREGILEAVDREGIDFTVVGPEQPLVEGLVDALDARGARAFGPTAAAARIEGSKAWAKELCARHGIPAPASESFDDITQAIMYLDAFDPPYVIKADGLAAGKGVVIAATRDEAVQALERSLVDRAFGAAGDRVVIEEFLEGYEVSAHALTDGRTIAPLALAQDFKRVLDGDEGPNTGGMGAYSPVPAVDDETGRAIRERILEPTVRAMEAEGVRFRGALYAGLMVTKDGPKALEFNCRFGDPETEVILPRLTSDLGEPLLACAEGNLDPYRLGWSADACVTVILASGGYPGEYRTGIPISGLQDAAEIEGVAVFHAGTARRGGKVVTAGGRVLAVTAVGRDLVAARDLVYEAAGLISFEGKHLRTDIAREAAGG